MTETTTARPTGVGLEEPPTTRVERFLAVVLAVFLLIGLAWCYAQPFDRTDDGADVVPVVQEDPAVRARDDARFALAIAREQLAKAEAAEATARETYRTKLDAKQPAAAEEAAFTAAQAETRRQQQLVAVAQDKAEAVTPAGDAAEKAFTRRYDDTREDRERTTLLLRLGLVLGSLLASFALFEYLRRRRSRYLPAGMAAIGAAAALAAIMTGDYLDVQRTGPVVLSLAGIALTVAALVAYQRYLARRLPARRVRKAECPYCGYPARGSAHCEGCGRTVIAGCTTCAQPRRVGARYCGACGAT